MRRKMSSNRIRFSLILMNTKWLLELQTQYPNMTVPIALPAWQRGMAKMTSRSKSFYC